LVANEQQNVMQMPQQAPPPRFQPVVDQPAGPSETDLTPSLIHMARAVAAICATRLLLLLAVLFSGVSLIWTIADPVQLRIIALGVYAGVVIWPLVVLNWRRG
jgi:hypothetical protein